MAWPSRACVSRGVTVAGHTRAGQRHPFQANYAIRKRCAIASSPWVGSGVTLPRAISAPSPARIRRQGYSTADTLASVQPLALQRFQAWFEAGGGTLSHIAFQRLPVYETSVLAQTDIPAAAEIARIPVHMCIHSGTAYHCPHVGEALQALKKRSVIDDRVAVCLFLANELRLQDASAWEPYLSILPTTFTTPLQYSGEQWEAVRATQIGRVAAFTQKEIEYTYRNVIQTAFKTLGSIGASLRLVTAEHYTRAHMLWWSRAFEVPSSFVTDVAPDTEQDVHVEALVPVLDLFNHTNSPSVRWSFPAAAALKDHCLQICTRENPVQRGQQLWNSYGRVSNGQLLLQYGFTLADNEFDSVILNPRGFGTEGALSDHVQENANDKVKLLQTLQLDPMFTLQRSTPLAEVLLWTRIWCLASTDTEGWSTAKAFAEQPPGERDVKMVLSAANDEQSVAALGRWLQKLSAELQHEEEAGDLHDTDLRMYKEGQWQVLQTAVKNLQDYEQQG